MMGSRATARFKEPETVLSWLGQKKTLPLAPELTTIDKLQHGYSISPLQVYLPHLEVYRPHLPPESRPSSTAVLSLYSRLVKLWLDGLK